jgi:adenylate cyclase
MTQRMASNLVHTLLVADCSEQSRAPVIASLQEAGVSVVAVDSVDDCLSYASTDGVHGFLLDMDLPGGGGIELCRRLRAMELYRVTPILIITERNKDALWSDALAAGCDDFLVRPVDPVILQARLRNLMEKLDYVQRLDRMQRSLARYVSPRTQRMLMSCDPTGILPQPEQQDLCILFTDIRGFTAMAQEIDPTVLFAKVSEQLGNQVEAVYRWGGYIDKFGGDGVMAVFDGSDHVRNACLCAIDIMERAAASAWLAGHGVMPLGIGLHRGVAVVGNIGWGEHLDYSVIGNTVNLAARLCGVADPLSIVVSADVYDVVAGDPRLQFSEPRVVEVRGVKTSVTVYQLRRN